MKLQRESIDYIKDISEAISKIQQFTEPKIEQIFKDLKTNNNNWDGCNSGFLC